MRWQCINEKEIDHPFKHLIWKRFFMAIALWIHRNEDANHYLKYLNTTDATGRMRYTMQTEHESSLEF